MSCGVHALELMNVPNWLVWSFWMCIKVFNEKCILYKMSLFLAWFQSMCAFGLLLSIGGVLTPFLPFPQHFRFNSFKRFWRWLWRRLGVLNHPSWVGPHFSREVPISSYEVVLVLRLVCSFLSFEYYTLYDLYVVLLYWSMG